MHNMAANRHNQKLFLIESHKHLTGIIDFQHITWQLLGIFRNSALQQIPPLTTNLVARPLAPGTYSCDIRMRFSELSLTTISRGIYSVGVDFYQPWRWLISSNNFMIWDEDAMRWLFMTKANCNKREGGTIEDSREGFSQVWVVLQNKYERLLWRPC